MICTILTNMVYPQTTTSLQFGNSCENGIINDTMKQPRSESIHMRFYWLKYSECQGKLHIHWSHVTDNLADYLTNHHYSLHHFHICSKYLIHLYCTYFELEVPLKQNYHVFDEGVLIGGSSPPPGSSLPPPGYPPPPLIFYLLS